MGAEGEFLYCFLQRNLHRFQCVLSLTHHIGFFTADTLFFTCVNYLEILCRFRNRFACVK